MPATPPNHPPVLPSIYPGSPVGQPQAGGVPTRNLAPLMSAAYITSEAIAGGAAGNHTVAGIDTCDVLLSVVDINAVGDVQGSNLHQTVIAGGAAGDHLVTGMLATDTLISVLYHKNPTTAQLLGAGVFSTIVAGGSIGDITVTGMTAASVLAGVIYIKEDGTSKLITAPSEIKAECTPGSGKITTASTDTTGGFLIITWTIPTTTVAELFTDITAECTVDTGKFTNGGGTATTGGYLIVNYMHAPGTTSGETVAVLTEEFTVTAADTINNVGGTVTTGHRLLVIWLDVP
jgi:hypothetical protein